MSDHTPGPWQTGGQLIITDEASTVGSDGRVIHHWKEIAEVRHFNANWTSPEGNANARLIAAAPELFDALRAITNWCREHTSPVHSPELASVLVDAVNVLKKVDPDYPKNGE